MELLPLLPGHVSDLYDRALDGDLIAGILDLLAEATTKATVLVIGQNDDAPAGNFIQHRGGDLSPGTLERLRRRPPEPWLEGRWQQPVGRIYQDEASDLTRNRPPDATPPPELDCGTGVVLNRSGKAQILVEIRYPRRSDAAMRNSSRRLLSAQVPHLVRAARIEDLATQDPISDPFMAGLLELVPFPAFVVDADRRVVNLNTRAGGLSLRPDGLFVGPGDRLTACSPATDAELASLVRRLGGASRQRTGFLSFSGEGLPRKFVTLTRLQNAPLGRKAAPYRPGRVWIGITVHDAGEPLLLTHDILWRTFGLSARESELAMSLITGETIPDQAQRRKMSKQTLRNQMVSVLRKTETARQSQLVALLTRLAISVPA
ncbi:helix-turn-helix transcriptional regulator (plasmid) [Cereibacter azotoformans]|uniref:helix-turn-helix transcriptional regulator n=1 Tax=Cereibacter azotoformans TaxID=43057 RepID=UPI003B2161CB